MVNSNINSYLINGALHGNSYNILVPNINSIGIRPNDFAHGDKRTELAEDFLLNSNFIRNNVEQQKSITNYLDDIGITMLNLNGQYESEETRFITLPQGSSLDASLATALSRRRSIRHYTGDSLELDYLASILKAANGVSAIAKVKLSDGSDRELNYRTAASAGGLYPIELFVASLNVKGLDRGLYHYNPNKNCLYEAGDADSIEALYDAYYAPDELISLKRANFICLFTLRLWKSMRKYGSRGLRYALLEAGAISQNIHLAVSGLGLGSVDYTCFYEDEINNILSLDGLYQTLIHSVVVGNAG